MSKALSLQVVAEGVETELQAAELRRLGCDMAQGFLFSPGCPAGDHDHAAARDRVAGCGATRRSGIGGGSRLQRRHRRRPALVGSAGNRHPQRVGVIGRDHLQAISRRTPRGRADAVGDPQPERDAGARAQASSGDLGACAEEVVGGPGRDGRQRCARCGQEQDTRDNRRCGSSRCRCCAARSRALRGPRPPAGRGTKAPARPHCSASVAETGAVELVVVLGVVDGRSPGARRGARRRSGALGPRCRWWSSCRTLTTRARQARRRAASVSCRDVRPLSAQILPAASPRSSQTASASSAIASSSRASGEILPPARTVDRSQSSNGSQ